MASAQTKLELLLYCFFKFTECKRKRAKGDVTVKVPGTGKITINGQDINYFEGKQEREQVS